jgi:hypothetical protein
MVTRTRPSRLFCFAQRSRPLSAEKHSGGLFGVGGAEMLIPLADTLRKIFGMQLLLISLHMIFAKQN